VGDYGKEAAIHLAVVTGIITAARQFTAMITGLCGSGRCHIFSNGVHVSIKIVALGTCITVISIRLWGLSLPDAFERTIPTFQGDCDY
jgi:hypothetical protein